MQFEILKKLTTEHHDLGEIEKKISFGYETYNDNHFLQIYFLC